MLVRSRIPYRLLTTPYFSPSACQVSAPGAHATTHDAVGFVPPVDIVRVGDEIRLRADLPGVTAKDVRVEIEGAILYLSGDRQRPVVEASAEPDAKANANPTAEEVVRCERRFGHFARRFSLPRTVDAAAIEASFKDGILEIRLPRAAEPEPRKIAIA